VIVFVHHADAVDPTVDAQRPLSESGRAQAASVAHSLLAHGVKPVCVWHSGKQRARQTAESIWKVCNPLAELSAIRGLLPDDPPHWIRDRLSGESRQVVVVGHFPHLPRVVQALKRDAGASTIDFPVHGAIALEEVEDGWVERWRVTPTT
jgi:phosphohistidine phosphatase